jgi:tungstate transport system substrate-binding protein
MYNYFVIVGPQSDPAGIRGLKNARQAFARIAIARAAFVSRGDDSGTNRMERWLWRPDKSSSWYHAVGHGMRSTLSFAAEFNAYTLTDRATRSNFKNRQNLEILTDGDPALFNLYSSIVVNPARWPPGRTDLARTWHEWLTSKPGLDAIRSYRINGEQVFFPLDNAAGR